MDRLKILDWYVHQGTQYYMSRMDHDYYLVGANGKLPNWNKNHRPLLPNVKLISQALANKMNFDVVIIRSPISKNMYQPHINRGSIPIAVVQTTNSFPVPKECRHIVWNSFDVMNKNKSYYKNKKHKYIVHGNDPEEFKVLDSKKNGRVLTVANVFKRRAEIMGYNLWLTVNRKVKKLDVIGHGNMDMYSRDRQAKTFLDLIKTYNIYSVYFNPTISSAMPRSRGEAAMCGCPIVSTNNFDIGRYFTNGKNAIITNNSNELIRGINRLLQSEAMREDYGNAAREVALKHFHIKDFIGKWHSLLENL